ncbi:hypothetical protein GLV94_03135 [Virgibacillus halodenitrificans]|uniref:hypothetical protein n=1 Tax=Virgibacillus halodenitrificans TaxID=1482 RepID=UPI0013712C17|nr:hypothetical protein [Virgibacillus halodenitrificans]MYL44628.1 hypothetical protein [Virgibacillus halodenitrificans]MYL56160.1 hypothetical protein [Virgibacillus halodenitrificans]
MSDVVLKFANDTQYQNFIQSIKNEVLQEIKPKPAYHPSWSAIRDSMEERFRGDYNNGCGHWSNNQQSMYAVFRLAFQQPTIKDLKNVDGERIKALHDELFHLIDKYREGN